MIDLQFEQRNFPAFGVLSFLLHVGQLNIRGKVCCAVAVAAPGDEPGEDCADGEGFRVMVSELGIPAEPPR